MGTDSFKSIVQNSIHYINLTVHMAHQNIFSSKSSAWGSLPSAAQLKVVLCWSAGERERVFYLHFIPFAAFFQGVFLQTSF